MTTQDQIAALAAELTRVGKWPSEWNLVSIANGLYYRIDDGGEEPLAWGNEICMITLLGVAAEVVMLRGINIAYFGVAEKWKINRKGFGFETMAEAVIAALKLVEKEEGK
jgi:hypothetical protein